MIFVCADAVDLAPRESSQRLTRTISILAAGEPEVLPVE